MFLCSWPSVHCFLLVFIRISWYNSYSLLPALSLDGILHVKIVEGSFTAVRFYEFIEGLLDRMQPFPGKNSVIVMDNARIHKDPAILDLIVGR